MTWKEFKGAVELIVEDDDEINHIDIHLPTIKDLHISVSKKCIVIE